MYGADGLDGQFAEYDGDSELKRAERETEAKSIPPHAHPFN